MSKEKTDEKELELTCPDCGGEMSWQGYRPLFPTCQSCCKSFHLDNCRT